MRSQNVAAAALGGVGLAGAALAVGVAAGRGAELIGLVMAVTAIFANQCMNHRVITGQCN